MKNIFRSLGVLTLLLALVGQTLAQNTIVIKPGAKVRYMIEKKVVSQDVADTYASTGKVELWTYLLLNKGYWEKSVDGRNLIEFDGAGNITAFNIELTLPTQSFMICDENGHYKTSGSVVFSQPGNGSTCGGRTHSQRTNTDGACGVQFIAGCPYYAYGNSPLTGTSALTNPLFVSAYVDMYTDDNGEEWYREKLFTISYDYPKVGGHGTTFYTRFWNSYEAGVESGLIPPTNLKESPGTSSISLAAFGLRLMGTGSWNPNQNSYQDWSYAIDEAHYGDRNSDVYGFIMGGVEIIADPEFTLAAGATCGGSDLQGSFKVNNWNGKDWSNYKAVKMYVNTAGGTRKDITAQTTVTPSLPLNTASTAADFNYTLASSAYMINGVPADSLIWAFEDEKSTLI